MNESKPQAASNTWKPLVALGGLTLVCCLGLLCYFAALFVVVDKNINLIPTPTLDLGCTEASCLNTCIQQLPAFKIQSLGTHLHDLSEKEAGYELARYRFNENTKQLDRIATPKVPDYLKVYQDDTTLHQRIWNYFNTIYPTSSNVHISYMVISINSSPERFSAQVWEMEGKWRLNVNLYDLDSSEYVLETFTHEYGHLLTLNDTQVKYVHDEYGLDTEPEEFDKMRSACQGLFFNGYACGSEKSYLNAFGLKFWQGEIYETWEKAFLLEDNDHEGSEQALEQLYHEHTDQFVTEYAATSPDEDIAETWTQFVMHPKPIGSSIVDQKVLFFYSYPELVHTRDQIIHNICQSAIEQK
jgi:hypothetical protein